MQSTLRLFSYSLVPLFVSPLRWMAFVTASWDAVYTSCSSSYSLGPSFVSLSDGRCLHIGIQSTLLAHSLILSNHFLLPSQMDGVCNSILGCSPASSPGGTLLSQSGLPPTSSSPFDPEFFSSEEALKVICMRTDEYTRTSYVSRSLVSAHRAKALGTDRPTNGPS